MDWEEQLRSKKLTELDLYDLFEKALRIALPERAVVRTDKDQVKVTDPNGKTSTTNLHNLWRSYRNNPEAGTQDFARFLRLAQENEDADGYTPILDMIVPLVRDQAYVDCLGGNSPVLHIAGDLWQVFAEDRMDSFAILMYEHLTRLNISEADLHRLALENLQQFNLSLQIDEDEYHSELTADSGLTASVMLLSDVWNTQMAETGMIYAIVPCRRTVLFSRSDDPVKLQSMASRAKELFEGDDHPISTTLLRFTNDRWQVVQN